MSPSSSDTGAAVSVPAGLVYVSDEMPGFSRLRKGNGFAYRAPDGTLVKDRQHLERIRKLAIPPAYERVWICPLPNGHMQATGRDARGRKQYRYHAEWRLERDADKFEHLMVFGHALVRVRTHVNRVLKAARGAPTLEVVLATLVRLLDTTMIRVGNDEYARSNKSYGLTTLRSRHVEVHGDSLSLSFRGKSGVQHEVSLSDPRVAKVVRRCQAMPGQGLFQYLAADGTRHGVGSSEVNEYLRSISKIDCTAKDFRTWHAERACPRTDAASLRGRRNSKLSRPTRCWPSWPSDWATRWRFVAKLMCTHRCLPWPRKSIAIRRPISGVVTEAAKTRRSGLSGVERRFLAFLEGGGSR